MVFGFGIGIGVLFIGFLYHFIFFWVCLCVCVFFLSQHCTFSCPSTRSTTATTIIAWTYLKVSLVYTLSHAYLGALHSCPRSAVDIDTPRPNHFRACSSRCVASGCTCTPPFPSLLFSSRYFTNSPSFSPSPARKKKRQERVNRERCRAIEGGEAAK